MYIDQIFIKKFRRLEDIQLGPFVQDFGYSNYIVLAGPNGGGKSSILELIGYALSSTWSLGWQLSRSFPEFSFEVAIAVTKEECSLIRAFIEKNSDIQNRDVLEYLDSNRVYYRSYNFLEGRYQENSNLYNRVHNLVSRALRNTYHRSLGFFLKSDRFYPIKRFSQNRLFQYQQIITRDHLWNMAFNTSDVQYNDMFEFLIQLRYHYLRQLGKFYYERRGLDHSTLNPPTDPLKPYDTLLQNLFPNYKFTDIESEEVPSNLYIKLPTGENIPFSDLSSGEKEVFFILSFFLRHDVNNAVIVIDEPELHLHPELGRNLIRTMLNIKPNNQIWLATHNPEILDEAGRDRVIYVERDIETQKAVVSYGSDESDSIRKLKSLFGYSGYIGIRRTMVFLEGTDTSSDRKLFSLLFPQYSSDIKYIPCERFENLPRINSAVLSILQNNLGSANYYLIRDRDYLTPSHIQKYNQNSLGNLYVLERHHIENYLLNEEIIAKVQTEIYNIEISPDTVLNKLKRISRNLAGEFLRDMVSFRMNLLYNPKDFSLGEFMKGQVILSENGEWDDGKLQIYKQYLDDKIKEINQDLAEKTNNVSIENLVSDCKTEIAQAIFGDGHGWKIIFPGKRILTEYAKQNSIGNPIVFQNTIIRELAANKEKIPSELIQLMERIKENKLLNIT